jgi:predicted O-methyltransferase YrrM
MLYRTTSSSYLPIPNNEEFDIIYIDGSHRAKDVLQDSVLAWPLLRPGGILIWDDYQWCPDDPKYPTWDVPGPSIDAFLAAYRRELTQLEESPRMHHHGWQIAVQKVTP